MAKCPICNAEMASDRRRTCSPACRQAAYRRRKSEEAEHPPVNNEPGNVQGACGPSALDGVNYMVTEYTVSALPDDHEAHRYLSLKVGRARDGRWVVQDGPHRLAKDGRWSHQRPDEPDRETWLDTYFFDLHTALELAAVAARDMYVNGRHVLDILKETTP